MLRQRHVIISPRRRRLWMPFRAKVALAVGLVAAMAVLLLAGVHSVNESQRVRQRIADENLRLATLLVAQVEGQVRSTFQELNLLARDPSFQSDFAQLDAGPMNVRLETAVLADPDLLSLAVIDTRGVMWANSSLDKSTVGLDVSQQRHVREVLATGQPGIGDAGLGLITRLPVVPLGVPVHASDGRPMGVLQASLSLARLSQLLDN